MSDSAPEKPLPSLPPPSTQPTTSLSSESRQHRAHFIRHILSEISQDHGASPAGDLLEDWARAIEDALDELSLVIFRENWLRGFRRRTEEKRKQFRQRRASLSGPGSVDVDSAYWGSFLNSRAVPQPETPQLGTGPKADSTTSKPSTSTSSNVPPSAGSSQGHAVSTGSNASSNPVGDKEKHKSKETHAMHHDGEPAVDQDEAQHMLTQIRKFTSTSSLSNPHDPEGASDSINHLVLCAAPFGSGTTHVSSGSSPTSTVAHASCVYMPGVFSVSVSKAPSGVGQQNTTILYGLNDWESSLSLSQSSKSQLRVIGGTFVLLGATSIQQHHSLMTVLRASIYFHLALVLDQHLYYDSGINLKKHRPKFEDADSPISTPGDDRLVSDYPSSPSTSTSGIRSSLFNFLSKRATSAFSHRSSTISNSPSLQQPSQYTGGDGTTGSRGFRLGRNRTIQVPRKTVAGSPSSPVDDLSAGATQRSSLDSIGRRIRRFSLRGVDAGKRGVRTKMALHDIDRDVKEDPNKPYSSALKRIEKSRDILSTSFDVVVPLPEVLVRLAKLEKEGKDERSTLLGFEDQGSDRGSKAWGRGMSGLTGFTRHQELSVLVSRSVTKRDATIPAGSSGLETSSRMAMGPHTAEPEALPSEDGMRDGKKLEEEGKEGKSDVKDAREAKEAPKDESVKLDSKETKPDAKRIATKDSTKETKTSAIRVHNPCGQPRWTTFWYYSESSPLSLPKRDHDPTLGEVIQTLSASFSLDCDEPRCHYKCGEHELKFVHDGVRVDVHLSSAESEVTEEGKEKAGSTIPLRMWETCAVCDKKSKVREMSDGTYLLSFAKYLELLIYSTLIHSSSICEHTTTIATNPEHESDSKPNKFNITRHFSASDSCTITFTLSEVKDIFELRLPRLQMNRTGVDGKDKTCHPLCSNSDNPNHDAVLLEEDRIQLRRDIKLFWEGVSDYLDKIEEALSGQDGEVMRRALPRLPSVTDDAYEDMFAPQTTSTISTYLTTGSLSSGDSMMDPVVVRVSRENHQHSSQSSQVSTSTTTTSATGDDPLLLLASMRYSFQRAEQSLYGQIVHTPITLLNDVRRSFLAAGRGAEKRVTAWNKKHLSLLLNANQQDLLGELKPPEPGWWDKKCHPLPGGYVVVQEGDLGSIIAFTLSSADYLMELYNAPLHKSTSGTNLASSTSTGTIASEPASLFQPSTPSAASATTTKGYKFFSNSTQQQQLDPDKEDVVWHETEACAAIVTRKEHARDSASLLSIRDMLRSRTPIVEPGGGGTSGTLSSTKAVSSNPPSAWSKQADAQLSKEEAGGTVSGLPPDTVEATRKVLQGPEATSTHINDASASSSSLSSIKREKERANDKETEKDQDRGKPPSLPSSAFSSISDVTVGMLQSALAPEVPPKDYPGSMCGSPPLGGHKSQQQQQQASASLANTLSNSLNYALRLVSSGASTPRAAVPPALPAKPHHGLLLTDGNVTEERPHIRYEVMVGKRIKLACTVYYAKQFDLLRKRCGIDDIFVKSLSHSANWAAEGGKSRANFWKTSDDRFVIKTLVNAWNVADLHVLLESGPSYFRYMESTVSKPTVLVKILGVYTVEVKNSESGTTSKVDLVVMENLFYNCKVDKTFDLKGIQGRKVKSSAADVQDGQRKQTLFDGEWIEGQQKALMLVRPEWKKVLREAVKSDADFLAKMNIMDYSLLLGIDLESKQLTCGLVDTVGSYTFAKTLEYKAKHGLQSGKDITVIPPAEYEERFVNAMEGYFIACPDKWSRPLDDRRIPHSAEELPSVL